MLFRFLNVLLLLFLKAACNVAFQKCEMSWFFKFLFTADFANIWWNVQTRIDRTVSSCCNTAGLFPLYKFLYEAKISCWRHMLTGSPFTACSYGLLYSNGNSTICSLTSSGGRDDMHTTDRDTIFMKHLLLCTWILEQSYRESTHHEIELDWKFGEENSWLSLKI